MRFVFSEKFILPDENKKICSGYLKKLPGWLRGRLFAKNPVVLIGRSSEDFRNVNKSSITKDETIKRFVFAKNVHTSCIELLSILFLEIIRDDVNLEQIFMQNAKYIFVPGMSGSDVIKTMSRHFVLCYVDGVEMSRNMPDRYKLCREIGAELEKAANLKKSLLQ